VSSFSSSFVFVKPVPSLGRLPVLGSFRDCSKPFCSRQLFGKFFGVPFAIGFAKVFRLEQQEPYSHVGGALIGFGGCCVAHVE